MLKLLKYELKKRKNTLIIGLIALVTLELLALYNLNKENVIFAVIFMVAQLVTAICLTFFDVAINYYNDFKKAQGTLLFLTPNKGSKIVGSKMLFGAMELIVGILIFVVFAIITNSVAVNMGYEGIEPIINSNIATLDVSFGTSNTWWIMTGFMFLVFLQYLTGQAMAVMSVTLGRTVLSRNRYNFLWAVLIFLGTNFVIQTINSFVLLAVGLGEGWFMEILQYGDVVNATVDVSMFLIIGGVLYIVWTAVAFVASSVMLNKRIDI